MALALPLRALKLTESSGIGSLTAGQMPSTNDSLTHSQFW
jgi:hypothetical protein